MIFSYAHFCLSAPIPGTSGYVSYRPLPRGNPTVQSRNLERIPVRSVSPDPIPYYLGGRFVRTPSPQSHLPAKESRLPAKVGRSEWATQKVITELPSVRDKWEHHAIVNLPKVGRSEWNPQSLTTLPAVGRSEWAAPSIVAELPSVRDTWDPQVITTLPEVGRREWDTRSIVAELPSVRERFEPKAIAHLPKIGRSEWDQKPLDNFPPTSIMKPIIPLKVDAGIKTFVDQETQTVDHADIGNNAVIDTQADLNAQSPKPSSWYSKVISLPNTGYSQAVTFKKWLGF